jgi:hypothetical protein
MSVHQIPLSGEQVWRRRARDVLERDGNSLEGAFSSRSRRDLARGGVQLSIETGPRSRGRPAPERGGILLEGAPSPQERRNLTRGGDRPSSEAKFHQCGIATLERSGVPPEVVQAACLVGRGPVGLSYACC